MSKRRDVLNPADIQEMIKPTRKDSHARLGLPEMSEQN